MRLNVRVTILLVGCPLKTGAYTGNLSSLLHFVVGRDGSVGIATRYGQDGHGISSCWDRDFSQPSRPALRLTQAPIKWVPGPLAGGKAAGAWFRPPSLL